ncbi:MAG: hypothetical protein FRX49_01476 [Trebouxia sp. A1-2]|nr:MAG: hypothetical protein FRX49_01476 [Trebouxia sp. A1-2]
MKATAACALSTDPSVNFLQAASKLALQIQWKLGLPEAIDVPWGLPASFNQSRYRDVAAVVGDTVTIHWNHTAGGQFSLWKIPSDTCPTNFSTTASGFAQLVSLHTAATVTLKMTEPGVVVFTSSGPGQCGAGVLVNVVVSEGKAETGEPELRVPSGMVPSSGKELILAILVTFAWELHLDRTLSTVQPALLRSARD